MPPSDRRRRRIVTEEPQRIHPDLLGRPLAAPWRRALAMGLDLALAAIPFFLLVLALTLGSIERARPGFLAAVRGALTAPGDSLRAARDRQWRRDVVFYVAERRPSALPDSVRAALAAGGGPALENYLDQVAEAETYGIALGQEGKRLYDPQKRALALDFTTVTGRWTRLLGAAGWLVGWLTLMTWLMRGRTPGKALLVVRVVRLDGRPLSFWSAWERAGGYGASLGTAGLGFLQVLWDPNRQAVHDRIAGTVVVREPRRGRGGRRTP